MRAISTTTTVVLCLAAAAFGLWLAGKGTAPATQGQVSPQPRQPLQSTPAAPNREPSSIPPHPGQSPNGSGLAASTTVPDAFAAFDRWFETYAQAESPEAAAALLAQGAALAAERRTVMARMIETNPGQALALAVPARIRRAVPPEVRELLEDRVGGHGELHVLARVPEPGEAPAGPLTARVAMIAGQTYDAYVYGRRIPQRSASNLPMHGIAIGAALALHERPARLLEPGEAEELGLVESPGSSRCPVSAAEATPAAPIQLGRELLYLCDPGHLEDFNARIEASEGLAASTSGGPNVASAPVEAAVGEKKLLIMRVVFSDDPESVLSESALQNIARAVREYFLDNSYGQLSLQPTLTPVLTLPREKSYYLALDEKRERLSLLLKHAREAATAAGFAANEYDLHLVQLKPGVLSSSWGSVGVSGAWLQGSDPITYCHEIGHNLGLHHANGWRTTDGSVIGPGYTREYDNRYDVMGGGRSAREHFGAYAKRTLGWLPESGMQEIVADGTYRLHPVDAPSLVAGRTYALTLRKDPARAYWIETRSHLWTDGPAGRSIVVNWSPSLGSAGPLLLDMTPLSEGGPYDAALAVGESFHDPALGVTILATRGADDSVEVVVAHLHTVAFEAESGVPAGSWPVVSHPLASQGASILLPEGEPDALEFAVTIPAAGEYTLWGRLLARQTEPVSLTVSIGDEPATELSFLSGLVPNAWRWAQFAIDLPAAHQLPTPRKFRLAAGTYRLRLGHASAALGLDLLRLTTDPAGAPPASISPIPAQRLVSARPSTPIPFTLLDVDPATVRLAASSTDNGLAHETAMTFSGSGLHRTLTITPSANRLGSAVITIAAVQPGGRAVSTSFPITVIGPVQALVDAAAPGATIQIPEGTHHDSIVIEKDLILQGAGPEVTILENGVSQTVITVTNSATVILRDLTISRGRGGLVNHGNLSLVRTQVRSHQSWDRGAGIVNGPDGWMSIEHSTVSGNRTFALGGGGILNLGMLVIENSTISSNQVLGGLNELGGGGILNEGSLALYRSTVSANIARRGPGLANFGLAELGGSIVAGNMDRDKGGLDLRGEFLSAGHNLIQNLSGADLTGDLTGNIIGQDARLGPLQDNGGGLLTHALLPGSPAIDQGPAGSSGFEQRGFLRAFDIAGTPNAADGSDIGAVEFTPPGERQLHALALPSYGSDRAVFRIVLTAQGDENRLDLSLRYDSAELSDPRVRSGLDARAATANSHADPAGPGNLRIALALPDGQSLRPGVRELAIVEFSTLRESGSALPTGLAINPEESNVLDRSGEKLATAYRAPTPASSEEPTLAIALHPDGRAALQLSGGGTSAWSIEATSDFLTWEPIGWVPAGGSPDPILDPRSGAAPQRFYRATRD